MARAREFTVDIRAVQQVSTMQVARLYDFGDIRVEESARPEVGDGDILVRASACGICSGDIMPWYIKRKAPLVLGHEPVGVVEQTGASVRDFKRGDRVFVHHHAPCFQCAACRRGEYVQCATWRATNIVPGGMAEYFLVSAANQRDTLRLPDSMSRCRRRADRAGRLRRQVAQAIAGSRPANRS